MRSPVPNHLTVLPAPAKALRPHRHGVDEVVIDEVVHALCTMNRARTLGLMLDVGALVVERLFGGDFDALRSRGRKDRSLRKLASHPKLPFSAATLWRAIAIYELVRRFPGLVEARCLGVSHLRAVLGLPPPVQERLLRAAESEKWSIDRLEQMAAEYSRDNRGRGGRPRVPGIVKAASRIERILGGCAVPDIVAAGQFSPEHCEAIRASLENLREWCALVERRMRIGEVPRDVVNA